MNQTTKQERSHNKVRDLVRAVALAIEKNPALEIRKRTEPRMAKIVHEIYELQCGDKRIIVHRDEFGPVLDCDIEPPTYRHYTLVKSLSDKTILESYSDIQGRRLVTLLENARYNQGK